MATQPPALPTERVRELLRSAFASVSLSPEWAARQIDVRTLRDDLFSLPPDALSWFLPRVLDDLLDSHTSDSVHAGEIDVVLGLLNVGGRRSSGVDDASKVQEANYLVQAKLDKFRDFTSEQAAAIVEWLRVAGTWEDTFFSRDEINSALTFWEDRAHRGELQL